MEEQIRACCLAISLIRLFFKFFFYFPVLLQGRIFSLGMFLVEEGD